ncbi:hypothetical protein [Nannocystis bainbridge]|uniref:MYXO-CTERM domain-containing protein n=1 Tax=Nannocystis bainbridge TaxID=2995303 RepID=A0ABT5E5B1_9BACT|nr:hypothetical protein [Nannocystis bainbridge]MDC0719972.1 hypothetical protein [Nannocystis bainbridge]
MAFKKSSIQAMTVALAGAAVVFPNEASACTPDPCAYAEVWQSLDPLNAGAIPTDGVLLLQGARFGDEPDEDWLATIDLSVTLDGQPIAGAIEASGFHGLLVWRPAEPLTPGDYKVTGEVDNPDYDNFEYCSFDFDLAFDFTVVAEPSTPLGPPLVERTAEVNLHEREELASLVCCDGAMPGQFDSYCGSAGGVGWEEGFCAVTRGLGVLLVEMKVDTGLPPATAALVVRQAVVDGEPGLPELDDALRAGSEVAFCTAVRLTNVATGEVVTSEAVCHGSEPEIVAQLGEQVIDPSAALTEACASTAYTCEIGEAGDRWDPGACTPWPGGGETSGDPTEGPTSGPGSDGSDGSDGSEGTGNSASGGQDGLVEHGCACDSRAPSAPWAWLLLGLGLLRSRRRSRVAKDC